LLALQNTLLHGRLCATALRICFDWYLPSLSTNGTIVDAVIVIGKRHESSSIVRTLNDQSMKPVVDLCTDVGFGGFLEMVPMIWLYLDSTIQKAQSLIDSNLY